MFSDDQKREHIRELQQLLHEISYYNKRIPRIIPDSVYGPETSGTVRIFQKEYGLPATGNTDFNTWEKIIEVNRLFYPNIVKPDVFDKDTVLIPGSAGPVVLIMQTMLNAVGDGYINMPVIALTGIYDAPTERSVNNYKRISGIGMNIEGVDAALWNNIVSSFNRLVF